MNMRNMREVATLLRKPMGYAVLAVRVSTDPDNKVDHNAVEGVREC